MYHTVVGLRIEPELVEAMKIRALKERMSLSEITQKLWIEYLRTKPKSQKQKLEEARSIEVIDIGKRMTAYLKNQARSLDEIMRDGDEKRQVKRSVRRSRTGGIENIQERYTATPGASECSPEHVDNQASRARVRKR